MNNKKTIFIVILLTSCCFLESCKLGKVYKTPELNLPLELALEEADSLAYADLKWWEIYTDTLLQQLIDKALNNNKDMCIAAARVQEFAEMKRLNVTNILPNIDGTAYFDREYENYRGKKGISDDELGVKLRMNWELDLWGNLRWTRERNIAEYFQSVEGMRALQMTLISNVAQAYFELIALDNELLIVRQTLHNRQEGVQQSRLRYEGGITSETSYQQAQVEQARTATLIPELSKRIAMKENEIALLIGDFPQKIVRSKIEESIYFPCQLPVGLPSELLKRRPDVRAAEQALIASNASLGLAYTDRFPRIALTGAYGIEGDQLSSLLQSTYGHFVSNLITPVFAFGKKQARYKAQQAAYEQETYRYEKTVLKAFKEVNDAIVNYNSSREARESKSKLEQAAKKYVDLAQLQYINGVINYLDVLDAHRIYFDASIGLSNAVRDEYIAFVQLYKALGGGW